MGETIITGPLYAARKKVYPQAVHGRFRRIKWGILAVALGIYYLLPFVRWDRGVFISSSSSCGRRRFTISPAS
jgi:polyferredoxin